MLHPSWHPRTSERHGGRAPGRKIVIEGSGLRLGVSCHNYLVIEGSGLRLGLWQDTPSCFVESAVALLCIADCMRGLHARAACEGLVLYEFLAESFPLLGIQHCFLRLGFRLGL